LTIILLSVLHIDAQRRRQKISDVNELLYTAEYINGKYIPKDMKDAFKTLDTMLTNEERNNLFLNYSDFSGMYLRNEWGLWSDSRLARYFKNELYIRHPDDMSMEIILAYAKWLKHEDIGLKELKRKNKARYSKELLEKLAEFEKIGLNQILDEEELERFTEREKKRLAKGPFVGDIVYFIFPKGCSTKEEEEILHKNGSYEGIADGVITDIRYYPLRLKVKLIKSTSPYGIILFDKYPNFDNLNNSRDFTKYNIFDKSVYFMKPGEEIWFTLKGHWEPYH